MKHISEEQWNAFYTKSMSYENTIALLEHVSQCTYCADCMAGGFPQAHLVTPPKGQAEEIMQRAGAAGRKRFMRRKEKELLLFSCRTIVGMALSIMLIFSIPMSGNTDSPPRKTHQIASAIHGSAEKITTALNTWYMAIDFSQE